MIKMLDPDFLSCELLTVPPDVAERAAAEIPGCEACSDSAQLPFNCILADAMNRPGMFEFILAAPVRCPLCHGPVTEKTLVDRVSGMERANTIEVQVTNAYDSVSVYGAKAMGEPRMIRRIASGTLFVILIGGSIQAQTAQGGQQSQSSRKLVRERPLGVSDETLKILEQRGYYGTAGYVNLPQGIPTLAPSCAIPLLRIPVPAGPTIKTIPANPSVDPKFVVPPPLPSCPPSVQAPQAPAPSEPEKE